MIALNYRRIYVLMKLLEGDQPLRIPKLATRLRCSQRSIRYDLDVIDVWLKGKGLPLLVRKHSEGIFYYYSSYEKDKILEALNELSAEEYEFNRKERIDFISLILLTSPAPFTIEKLVDVFHVSRATILKDLDAIEKKLETYRLVLKRQTRIGIWIEGSEINIRQKLIYLNTRIHPKTLKIITTSKSENSLQKMDFTPSLSAIIDELQVNRIQSLVEPLLKFFDIQLSDDGQVALYLHIGMVLKRLGKSTDFTKKSTHLEELFTKKEYQIAILIKMQIERNFHITLPEEEVTYITLHLLGNQSSPVYSAIQEQVEDQELVQYISRMTLQVEKISNAKFNSRESLINGLFLHIRPAIYRSTFGLVIENPLVDEIKSEFADVYYAVETSLQEIKTVYNVTFTDSEIAYIAMHYCGALSKLSKTENEPLQILVICTSGIGTANLLKSRILSSFTNITVLQTLSYSAFLEQQNWDADLIISTIDISHTKIPFIKVNPLLPESDYEKLARYLEPKTNQEQPLTAQELYETVWPVLEKELSIKNPTKLTEDLIQAFESFLKRKDTHRHAQMNSLEDILVPDFIQLDEQVSNWREAIEIAAKPLERTGAVGEDYKYEIISILEERGPYMAVAPGIMLAHGKARNVNRVALSFTRLHPPIRFGHKTNDPIQLLFMFVSSNDEIQVPALQQLLEHLINQETREILSSARTVNQIVSILKS